MGNDLEDVFGEEFANQYEQEVQKRRERRNKIDEEQKKQISHLAVNEGKLDSSEPQFEYQDDRGITHNVLLMTFPDREDIWGYMNELDSGAVSIPFDYMGDWKSCLFNESVKSELKRLNPGDTVVMVGNLDEYEDDEGNKRENVSPARGFITMEELDEWSTEAMESEGFSTSDDGSSEESPFGSGGGDEKEERITQKEAFDTVMEEYEEPLTPSEAEDVALDMLEVNEDLDMATATKFAKKRAEIEEEEDEDEEEDSSDNENKGGTLDSFGSSDDEDEEEEDSSGISFGSSDNGDSDKKEVYLWDNSDTFDKGHIETLVNNLADDEPAVWDVEEGSEEATLVAEQAMGEVEQLEEEHDVDEVEEACMKVIEEHREEDDEDDDGSFF